MALAIHDVAIIPLYFQKVTWATRKGITYTANMSEFTTAKDAGVE